MKRDVDGSSINVDPATQPAQPRVRPTKAVVNLAAIAFNIQSLKRHIGPGPLFMTVVKADAYGHGIVPVARTAVEAGSDWIGVALIEEAMVLRRAGIKCPILVLGEAPPQGAGLFVAHNIAATVCSVEALDAINGAARAAGTKAKVHIKVDTGMGRIGLAPQEVLPFVERTMSLSNVDLEGMFSHFASADEEDKTYAYRQLQRYRDVIATMEARGIRIPLKHLAGSAATIELPESHFDMVRPGVSIYGSYPSPQANHYVALRPAMALVTAITFLKEVPEGTALSYGRTFVTKRKSKIATLPVGYGDGYPRSLSNKAEVLVKGRRAPVVGRVCMDMTLIDVTDIPGVELGCDVVLFGTQGSEEILVDEVAAKAGTISYEVLCNISKRVPRDYVGMDM